MIKFLFKKISLSCAVLFAVMAYQPQVRATTHDKLAFVSAFVRCASVMTESFLQSPGAKAEATANIARMANLFLGFDWGAHDDDNDVLKSALNLPQLSFALNALDAVYPSLLKTQPQKRTKSRRALLVMLGAAESALVLIALNHKLDSDCKWQQGAFSLQAANILSIIHSIVATDNNVKKALHAAVVFAILFNNLRYIKSAASLHTKSISEFLKLSVGVWPA